MSSVLIVNISVYFADFLVMLTRVPIVTTQR